MGLETLVRPLAVPDVRPRPTAGLLGPSTQDPIKIDGGAGQEIALSHSRTWSWSSQREREVRRVYDVMRVHNPDDDQQFVDVEVVRGMALKNANGTMTKRKFEKPPADDNIEIQATGKVRNS
jgi:hypothetical protein